MRLPTMKSQHFLISFGQAAAAIVLAPFASAQSIYTPGSAIYPSSTSNTGIGTSNPQFYFESMGANFKFARSLTGGFSGSDYDSIGYNFKTTSTAGSYEFHLGDTSSMLQFYSGGFRFFGANTGSAGTPIPFTELMRVTREGRVGIGTGTPTHTLHVDGSFRVGNLTATGNTLETGALKSHWLELSGYTANAGNESNRFEVARICTNTYHWQASSPIEIELRRTYWAPAYLKFIVSAGYLDFNGQVMLVEKSGIEQYANVSLGAPVATGTSAGGYPNQYIPLYIDLGYYGSWSVKITHAHNLTTTDVPPQAGDLRLFNSPAPTIIPGFPVAKGTGRLEQREIFAGKVGVGTDAPETPLHVSKRAVVGVAGPVGGGYSIATFTTDSNSGRGLQIGGPTSSVSAPVFLKVHGTSSRFAVLNESDSEQVTVLNNGNVGIGTINPGQKLSVNGTIRSKEIVVETVGWADYVFADNYSLKPLSEVEQHIKQHKHLPGVPSAAEVSAKGVSVGEMQAKLLAKIEELTLHQIEQEKRLNAALEKIKAQGAEIAVLKKDLN